jgi:hypothetical protein
MSLPANIKKRIDDFVSRKLARYNDEHIRGVTNVIVYEFTHLPAEEQDVAHADALLGKWSIHNEENMAHLSLLKRTKVRTLRNALDMFNDFYTEIENEKGEIDLGKDDFRRTHNSSATFNEVLERVRNVVERMLSDETK